MQNINSNQPLHSTIGGPIEVHFSKWHIWWRMGFGIFWFIIGLALAYIIFFLATEKSTFGTVEKVLFPLIFPILGYFTGIRPGLKMLNMKTPRIVLHSDKLEYFDFDGSMLQLVYWKDVRQIGYHWYDDGTIASKFTINLEVLNASGKIETVALNVKGLSPDKDWIYRKIQQYLQTG